MDEVSDNPLHSFDRAQKGDWDYLAGVDEAGRGALAGPVVAGAVLLSREFYGSAACRRLCPLVNDSKKLSAKQRETVFNQIVALRKSGTIECATGSGSVEEIADANIIGATTIAMRRALESVLSNGGMKEGLAFLGAADELPLFEHLAPVTIDSKAAGEKGFRIRLLIDGLPVKLLPYPHAGVVKGDGKSLAIAMASVLAKVTRDRMMSELDGKYPVFGLAGHKGYGTRRHLDAIREHGPCILHRERFLRKLGASKKRQL